MTKTRTVYIVQINTIDGPLYYQGPDNASERIEDALRLDDRKTATVLAAALSRCRAFLGVEGGSYRVVPYVLDGVMRDLAIELEPMDPDDIGYCRCYGNSLDCVEDVKYRIYAWCDAEDDRGEPQLDPMSPHAVY